MVSHFQHSGTCSPSGRREMTRARRNETYWSGTLSNLIVKRNTTGNCNDHGVRIIDFRFGCSSASLASTGCFPPVSPPRLHFWRIEFDPRKIDLIRPNHSDKDDGLALIIRFVRCLPGPPLAAGAYARPAARPCKDYDQLTQNDQGALFMEISPSALITTSTSPPAPLFLSSKTTMVPFSH